MNSKTFQKRVNQSLKEIVGDAIKREADPSYLPQCMNPFVEVNKSRIYLSSPIKKDHTIEFMCTFDPTESEPKDIAKFILFGLTINHVIEITNDKTNIIRYFRIDNVKYIKGPYEQSCSGTWLLVTVNELIGLETGMLPNGQKVYRPIIPENNI